MRRIRTKPVGPPLSEIPEVVSGFSLYRATHFYARKEPEELEQVARDTVEARILVPKGMTVRLRKQLGLAPTFYREIVR